MSRVIGLGAGEAPRERISLIVRGDPEHGVDRYAARLAQQVVAVVPSATMGSEPGDDADLVHLHFTDKLWGPNPAAAAAAAVELAGRTPLSVTLHDIPQASDGAQSLVRRLAAYRTIVERADVVICNSEYERMLLEAVLQSDVDALVAPLPSASPAPRPASWQPTPAIGVLGFFYPGKGHREVVEASAALDEPLPVLALGRAASGHEDELAALVSDAAALGVRFDASGYLSDAELLRMAQDVLVPVIAHQHVSASGSLTDWFSAGRRPVTIDNEYFREMERLRPGSTTLFEPGALTSAIANAARDPQSTWIAPGADLAPHLEDTIRAYIEIWQERLDGAS